MKYFPSINYFVRHPSKSRIFIKNKNIKPDSNDIEIISNFLNFFTNNKFQIINDGEWNWINKNKRSKLISSLMSLDNKFLLKNLVNMFRSNISYGIISSTYNDILKNLNKKKTFGSDILKNIEVWNEFTKNKKKDEKLIFTNNTIGNPYGLIYKKKLVLYDTPRHDYYAEKIINTLQKIKNPVIIEIGGGYGGLLVQLLKRKFKFKYVNIDLPETLIFSYYYISKYFKRKINITKFLTNSILKKNQINFIPYSDKFDIDKPVNVNLVFNANSFSEMPKKIINKYFNLINKKLIPNFIFHQNSNVNLFPNSKRHLEIQSSDFPIDFKKYTKLFSNVGMFQGGSGRYREYLFKRKY